MNTIPFHVMAKPVGPECNLKCDYCFYYEKKNIFSGQKVISFEILEKYIEDYISSNPADEIIFGWQGGEPTLAGLSFFEQVITLQKKYKGSKKILNTLQTNGILLDESWAEFLKNNKFLVGISIDGPRDIHDRYRKRQNGKGTFEDVVHTIQLLRKGQVEFNTLTCVHRHNWMKGKEIYRFLKSVGSKYLQFIPIVERKGTSRSDGLELVYSGDDKAEITNWSILPEQWGHFLNSIFDEWVKEDVGQIYVQLFDVTLAGWVGMDPPLCVHSKKCGRAVILEKDGSVYSCDHFVYPEYRLGNIMEKSLAEMVNSDFQNNFGLKKMEVSEKCKGCEYLFVCNGGCPKHRFVEIDQGKGKQNYLCEGYYMFFKHVAPYMDYMAEQLKKGLPPANIMNEINKRKSVNKNANISPNAPCPCGSGKKFKKCCGRIEIL